MARCSNSSNLLTVTLREFTGILGSPQNYAKAVPSTSLQIHRVPLEVSNSVV
jgi:hypothetical protein